MRVLLIGSTGFVGRHLLEFLAKDMRNSITAVVHKHPASSSYPQVKYIISHFGGIPSEFLEQGKFDYIFHLARISGKGYGNIGRFIAGIKGYFANKKLVRRIEMLSYKPVVLYMSGSLMYGDNRGVMVDEDVPLRPIGFGKYYSYSEKPLLQAMGKGRFPIMMLRAPWIIGNGSWFKQLYLDEIKTKKIIPVYGNQDRIMSLITVEDCAGMMWHYAVNGSPGIYNVFTFQKVLYREFVHLLKQNTEASFDVVSVESMKKKYGDTVTESVCSEIVLATKHDDLLRSYDPVHKNLKSYIGELNAYAS